MQPHTNLQLDVALRGRTIIIGWMQNYNILTMCVILSGTKMDSYRAVSWIVS